jgi:antitoxin MazE
MRVSKWGNSLAIRLPATIVKALELKDGDQVEIRIAADRQFEATDAAAPARGLHS